MPSSRTFARVHARGALAALGMATLIALAPFAGAPATANEQRIAVLVNDDPISEFDIAQRLRLMRISGAGSSRSGAINELIDEKLKLQRARRLGITVTDEEVNGALGNLAQRINAGNLGRLRQALGAQGVNMRTLEDRFRADLAWRDVVRRQLRQTVPIREADVLAALRTRGEDPEETKTIAYTLSQVIVVIPSNASNTLITQRRRDAERLRSNITSCRNVRAVASAFRDVTVRDIGERQEDQLPEGLQSQLDGMRIGGATAPERRSNGFEVVVVCDRREVSGLEAARSPMESQLRNEQGDIMARRLLRDLRADALIEYR